MSKLYIINFSGTNVQAGVVNIPPGSWEAENTAAFRSAWNDGTNTAINDGESCHVATFGSLPTVEVIGTIPVNYSNLMTGFGLVFCLGLAGLGARWVGRILKGGLNE